ncbi:hypothetical protein DPMN_017844 [Dreissena polymorpha]|uniref:Uncharacterized protein n=1 Tax=Dreissena polymorpha TaxID=45954 RepID=A0A9D4NHA4_DREPO|nr:hypothetical protein DPMN_017844 [Dreissena polymorpha]
MAKLGNSLMVEVSQLMVAMVPRHTAVVEATEAVVVAAAMTATVEAVVVDMAAAVMVVAVVDMAAEVTVVVVDVDRRSISQECWVLVYRLKQI